jgi:hypothetical protein
MKSSFSCFSDWMMIDLNECLQRDIYCNPMEMRSQLYHRLKANVEWLRDVNDFDVVWLQGIDSVRFAQGIPQIIVANRNGPEFSERIEV